ncbi:MAG TPA: DUF2249 domain-containing protein [Thermoanaerobaculia bacterium]|nr:DUF2249 domain-containing protein [Thermoanaerobaculia bacterium]
MSGEPRVIDVRPILQSGGEPLDAILAAAETVAPGEALVVIAPFEPMPLYGLMRQMGFSRDVEELDGGGFRVTFTRG